MGGRFTNGQISTEVKLQSVLLNVDWYDWRECLELVAGATAGLIEQEMTSS